MSRGDARTLRAGRRTVEIQRPGKVLFPGGRGVKEYTKGDLADYSSPAGSRSKTSRSGWSGPPARSVRESQRCRVTQAWSARWEEGGGVVAHDVRDRADFAAVRDAAHWVRELLDELGLPAAPMTTGSRGLHLVVPLDGRHDFDEVRRFAHDVAEPAASRHPDRLTTAARKQHRADRLYLDVQRNGYAQTAVAPYTVRARPGAPVAVPLAWKQVDDPSLDARRWSIADAVDQARTEPWGDLLCRGRSLGPARRRLDDMRS